MGEWKHCVFFSSSLPIPHSLYPVHEDDAYLTTPITTKEGIKTTNGSTRFSRYGNEGLWLSLDIRTFGGIRAFRTHQGHSNKFFLNAALFSCSLYLRFPKPCMPFHKNSNHPATLFPSFPGTYLSANVAYEFSTKFDNFHHLNIRSRARKCPSN